MQILIVGKYPPIQGGVAAHTYWLARGLGETGHRVSVVTNANRVEEMYRIPLNLEDAKEQVAYEPENVSVFSLSEKAPRHAPYSESFVTRLVNLGLRAIEKNGADVIYAHYLEPYGVAALMLKELTGLPLVVRHAGSDIYRLFTHTDYSYVLGRVLKNADIALMSHSLFYVAEAMGIEQRRLRPIPTRAHHPAFSPEGSRFDFPQQRAEGIPTITYMGKASAHKGLLELLSVVPRLENDFRLMLVSKGPLLEEMQRKIDGSAALQERVMLSDFVPPWRVPALLRASDLLVQLENRFPIPIHAPGQPYEGIACGTPLLVSDDLIRKLVHSFPGIREKVSVVPDPEDTDALRRVLADTLSDLPAARARAAGATIALQAKNDWKGYVDTHLTLFQEAAHRSIVSRVFRPRP